MLGHLLYEDNEIDTVQVEAIYKEVGKLAFEMHIDSKAGSVGESTGSSSSKLQRVAINCLANLFLKPNE